jgi:suppressor of G2 allele of SKP1
MMTEKNSTGFDSSLQNFGCGDMAYVEERYGDAIRYYTAAIQPLRDFLESQARAPAPAPAPAPSNQEEPPPVVEGKSTCISTTSTSSFLDKLNYLYLGCLLHRAKTYYQLQQYDNANLDLTTILTTTKMKQYCGDNNAFYSSHERHLYYRLCGLVAYHLQKYDLAKTTFDYILQQHEWFRSEDDNGDIDTTNVASTASAADASTTTNSNTTNSSVINDNNNSYDVAYYQKYIQSCLVQSHLATKQPPPQPLMPQSLPGETVLPSSSTTTAITTATATATVTTKPTTSSNNRVINPATLVLLTPKYQYYQNDTHMIIQILEPNLPLSHLTVQYIENQQIHIQIHKQGYDIVILQGELYDTIIPSKCTVSCRTEKVIIKLRKERSNYEWQTLLLPSSATKASSTTPTKSKLNVLPATAATKTATATNQEDKDIDESSTSINATPTDSATSTVEKTAPITKRPTPYASPKDWDMIAQNVDEELAQDKPEGDAAMQQLFQQIYAQANDDTKRAMIKSYQTSGGTVLSTNWQEVAQKDYETERTAPDGQEWKTWEGKKLSNESK